ncbi:MAG: radical SAM protein [Candidatus Parvarchaeum sp.]
MLNTNENDVNYLIKDKMMRKGFRYLYKNSKEFRLEIVNLRRNVSMLANDALTTEDLNKVKSFIDHKLNEYIRDMKSEHTYIAKNIKRLTFVDARLLLAELYFKSQLYFLYNEVFTYGAISLILQKQIAARKLNLNDTLLKLSNLKGTAVHMVFEKLKKIKVPSTKSEFLRRYMKDKIFRRSIDAIYKELSEYFEEDLSPSKLYDMIKASKEYPISIENQIDRLNLDDSLIKLYILIIDTQRKLFISQNIYMRAMKCIFKSFKDLEKSYGNRNPKGSLLVLYLDKIKEFKKYRLAPPNVYYKGFVFNLDQHKRLHLSDSSASLVEAVINRKIAAGIPVLKTADIIKRLEFLAIIKKRDSRTLKPDSYIFMLELALGCNLNCTICFNRSFKRHRIITIDEWYKIIYSIPKASTIMLFGGEPFLYPWIGKLLDFMQNVNIKEGRNWKIESFTNGVLTDKIFTVLKGRERIKLIFSIDGLADAHDSIRGKGAFEHAVETIKKLKAETVHEIEVRSVVTANNYNNIGEFIKFFKELGVDKVTFNDLHVTGNAKNHLDYVLTPKQRSDLLHKLGNLNDPKLTNDYQMDAVYPNSCGIGFNRIYIRSDGLVDSCSELDNAESSIFDAKLDSNGIIINPRELIPKFERDEFDSDDSACAKCGLLYLCGGGCRTRVFKQEGNIYGCDVVQKTDIIDAINRMIK